jgi:hypothetical protein
MTLQTDSSEAVKKPRCYPGDRKRLRPDARDEQERPFAIPCPCRASSLNRQCAGYTAFDLTLRLSRLRSCLVPASSKPVMAENISADAFIMVVRTFRPFSARTNPAARAIVRVGFPAQQAPPHSENSERVPVARDGNGGLGCSVDHSRVHRKAILKHGLTARHFGTDSRHTRPGLGNTFTVTAVLRDVRLQVSQTIRFRLDLM